MKIVHICLCSPFYESYAYQDNLLPKYHSRAGHEVCIITSPYTKSYSESVPSGEYKLDNGIKLIRLNAIFTNTINSHVHCYYGLYKIIEQETPDLIFVHGVESINYLCLPKYKRNHPQVKIVFDNHTDYINSLHHWSTKVYSKLVIRGIIVKRLIPIAVLFYGTTPARSLFLKEYYSVPPHLIKMLPMGADDEVMHMDEKQVIRERTRKHYNIGDNDFLLVTGGRIDKSKNTHVFAQAVSEINKKDIKLLIFGTISNDLKGLFAQMDSERVINIGWQPANNVYSFFYAADLIVFPGNHSVLWEQAVASKVPCAFSKIDGFEHIDFGGNCELMNGKNVDYYKSFINKVYQDKSLYRRMKEVAASSSSDQFLYSHIAQQVINDISV